MWKQVEHLSLCPWASFYLFLKTVVSSEYTLLSTFYSCFCSVPPEKLGAVLHLGILYMLAILSLMKNTREHVKDLYTIIIHLLENCIIFCSVICEMDLVNASHFLRSRISLTPPIPGRLWNTWSTSYLECPHMIWAKWCLGTAVSGPFPWRFFL